MRERYKKKKSRMEDVLLKPKEDRRKLSNVPDKTNTRSNIDRRNITEIDRNTDMEAFIKSAKSGIRYQVDYEVLLILKDKKGKKRKIHTRGIDISASGILLRCNEEKW